MTKRLTGILLMTILFTSAVFSQTVARTKVVRTVTIHIDGFMKSKSGAI